MNEIFKFPPHFDLFCQVNCLYKLSSGYPKDPIQNWYIWASFQDSRKRFRKLQEAILLTVMNEIFKFPPYFDLFWQVNCLYQLSSGYPKDPIQKWYIWTSFQTSRKRFRKLQEAIWLTVIYEIFKVLPHFDPFCQVNYSYEPSSGYAKDKTQKWHIWTSFQTSKVRFRKLPEALWLIIINEICKFQFHLFFKWTVCLNFLEFIRIT